MTAPSIRITARVARRLLREVVAEAGWDHVVRDGCTYMDVWRRCPNCIVGRVLHRAGVTEEELSEMDARTPTVIARVQLPARVWMSRPARRVLEIAQVVQDDEQPWGMALDTALLVRPWARAS